MSKYLRLNNVSSSFIPEENKEKLILICGHYTFSYPSFLKLKEQLKIPIDDLISSAILSKLNDLYGIFRNKVLKTEIVLYFINSLRKSKSSNLLNSTICSIDGVELSLSKLE